ncbi:DNA cytosine methyltransferase [Mariluticola halotolerans]|uniref:DNA cytosine methyltransferase n=1 Tax=Mariluticola halotolerans TaxID=2909283 RepID=UPI0026E397CC|nr:DNA cytosine methyltransferase [Mariluticola halotolerans]UJQ93629.1 DNA cytosine methyltransferase [Mariluticola halotolerans]
MSLGFEQAGFDVVAAVELDPVHAAVHKFNFPDCAVIPRSVTDVSGADIRQAAKIGDRAVDVVFGGAPCQGFSLIGQRALDDPRNALVQDFVRIVKELDATCFVFENVKGLTVGKHRKFLFELIEEFEALGYDVQKDWRVLNAADYGVPQDRQRLILMGTKKGGNLPNYPRVISKRTTCVDALGDLPDAESFEELLHSDYVDTTAFGNPSKYAEPLRGLGNDAWGYGYPRNWNPNTLTSSARTGHTDISRRRFRETDQGRVEPISRFFKLSSDGVSNTLRAGTDSARGAFTSPRPIHYAYARCITVREMARLHGFPDWFRFNATKWHGARQIGNAVPPPLARAVATAVIKALGVKRTRPSEALDLGDERLLTMGNTEAAAHFNIANPIGRRDKKSGTKKRKQAEIELAERKAANVDNVNLVNVGGRAEFDDPDRVQVITPQAEAAHS